MAPEVDFSQPPDPTWNQLVLPGSEIENTGSSWRLVNAPIEAGRYTNAQIDDYQKLHRRDFLWRPPLTLTVRARFSHPVGELVGTAGFGFWNDPFMMTGARMPALPRAIWFFHASPPSDMKLDMQTPGRGWKAATIDAIRLPFFLLAPTIPVAVSLMNIPTLYRALWPVGQRAIGVSEALIDADMTDWHTYRIEWGVRRALFWVDGRIVLDCDTPPSGPLGFVMWIDNQAMIATPQGRFGWRTLDTPRQQWMAVDVLAISECG
ncbi:MAG: hypothetical protein JXB07_04825 [Anaerolineae bacterium]|nr:hypothetical protein [Anaerolineae bacterium]